MTADNSGKWSFIHEDVAHFWTTGKDYTFEIDDDTVTFGSDTAESTTIPLLLAQDFADMFGDLFGIDLTQYSTSDEDASGEDADTTSTED